MVVGGGSDNDSLCLRSSRLEHQQSSIVVMMLMATMVMVLVMVGMLMAVAKELSTQHKNR